MSEFVQVIALLSIVAIYAISARGGVRFSLSKNGTKLEAGSSDVIQSAVVTGDLKSETHVSIHPWEHDQLRCCLIRRINWKTKKCSHPCTLRATDDSDQGWLSTSQLE